MNNHGTPTTKHCAIYTRKSVAEGLEQAFSSLDAQRESAEAYIASQRHQGWVRVAQRYDDGGCTGGNLERPALQRLLADLQAGHIDVVVFNKVDRLSRSLLDFARLMETFEKHQVAFVAVTQQFNSATSMGRLVLNVLLSFAQFERELIAERTRDKIAAARRRGRWAGGHPLLGYDVDPRGATLSINEAEAVRVRAIFALYLEHQSLGAAVAELFRRRWFRKQWLTRSGQTRGGGPFTKSTLHLDDQIRIILNMVSNDLKTWRFLAERFSTELFVGVFLSTINQGFEVSPTTMNELAERRLRLALDIYYAAPSLQLQKRTEKGVGSEWN
jgi:site-specific DNA recombinase